MITFDTNALLDIYLFSDESIEVIVDYLEISLNEILIPHQVYREFIEHYEKRREKRNDYVREFDKKVKEQCKLISNTIESFSPRYKRYESDLNNLFKRIDTSFKEFANLIRKELHTIKKRYIKENNDDNDIVLQVVNKIYNNNVDKDFSILEKVEIVKDAKLRFELGLAPGFTDVNKDGLGIKNKFAPYGDLFIWREILDCLRKKPGNLRFITNEKKVDWWQDSTRQKPAEILLEEYQSICPSGQYSFSMTNLNDFLLNNINDPGILAEIEEKIYLIKTLRNYKKENILFDDNVKAQLLELIDDSVFYEKIIGESGWVGNIEDVEIEDIDLDSIIINTVDFDEGSYTLEVEAVLKYKCNGSSLIYVSRDFSEYCGIKIELSQQVCLSYSVFLDKDNVDECIEHEDILNVDYYIVNYDVDNPKGYEEEDFENGIYGTCPECSAVMDDDNLGGNGFCIRCAPNH